MRQVTVTELKNRLSQYLRLVKNGVFDFAFGLPGYVAAENAIFEGADLSSLTQDIDTQRKVAEVLNLSTGGTVSKQLAKLSEIIKKDKTLSKTLADIDRMIQGNS